MSWRQWVNIYLSTYRMWFVCVFWYNLIAPDLVSQTLHHSLNNSVNTFLLEGNIAHNLWIIHWNPKKHAKDEQLDLIYIKAYWSHLKTTLIYLHKFEQRNSKILILSIMLCMLNICYESRTVIYLAYLPCIALTSLVNIAPVLGLD